MKVFILDCGWAYKYDVFDEVAFFAKDMEDALKYAEENFKGRCENGNTSNIVEVNPLENREILSSWISG